MFERERVFMPVPQQLGRGDRMGRGPYEKSGILADTALPPRRTVTQDWEIFFPVEETENDDGDTVRNYTTDQLELDIQLWYQPYGTPDDDAVLWRQEKRTVKINTSGL